VATEISPAAQEAVLISNSRFSESAFQDTGAGKTCRQPVSKIAGLTEGHSTIERDQTV